VALVYLDVEGGERARSEWDMHHPFNRASMRGPGERRWADLFRIAMFKDRHNQGKDTLHWNAPHLPKPSRDLAYTLRVFRYEQMREARAADTPPSQYDQLIDLSQYIHDLAETAEDSGVQKECARISRAFELQMPWILLGQVEKVETSLL